MMSLLAAHFLVIPLLVAAMSQFLPPDPLIRSGVLLVLLAPCIDHVVTFAHLGRANAKLLLAATPALLLLQMALLPIYLTLFLGDEAARLVQVGPFLHAFLWLIAVPLGLAGLVQLWAGRTARGVGAASALGILPMPATALVLFVVVAAVPQLGQAWSAVLTLVPFYIAFAFLALFIGGGGGGEAGRSDGSEARGVAFSAATRNSLSVPGALPILSAIIVAPTVVELVSELVCVRAIPRLGTAAPA